MKNLSWLFNPIAIALALNFGAGISESSANRGFSPSSPPASIGCMAHTFNEPNGKIIKGDPRFFTNVTYCMSIAKQINRASSEIPAITITKIEGGSAERPLVLTLGILYDRPNENTGKPPYCVISYQPDPNDPTGNKILEIKAARTIDECLLGLLGFFHTNSLPPTGKVFIDYASLEMNILQPKQE